MEFERDKRNNPAKRSATDAQLGVARVVQLEEMNWGSAILKSGRGAAFAKTRRAFVVRTKFWLLSHKIFKYVHAVKFFLQIQFLPTFLHIFFPQTIRILCKKLFLP